MIRTALWVHASAAHFLIAAGLAVAVGFTSFIGVLFLARCAWRRRFRWTAAARRFLGTPASSPPAASARRIPPRPGAPRLSRAQIAAQAALLVELAEGWCVRAAWDRHTRLLLAALDAGSESDD